MRKCRAVRPRLESIEDRLVPSIASLFDPTAGIRAAISSLSPSHHAQAAKPAVAHHRTVHGAKAETATHHPHASKAAHVVHRHQAPPPKSTSSGNSFSDFFKNLFSNSGL
jgi:hypothetical protein